MTPTAFTAALWHLSPARLGHLRTEGGLWTDHIAAEVPADESGRAYEITARLFARLNPGGPREREAVPFPTLAAMTHHAHPGHAVEDRFREALMANLDTIDRYLEPILRLAARDHLTAAWGSLLTDLCHWEDEDRAAHLRWSRAFWGWQPARAEQPDPESMTTPEVASLLGIAPSRVRQLIASGALPSRKQGRDRLIQRGDAEALRGRNQSPGRPRR